MFGHVMPECPAQVATVQAEIGRATTLLVADSGR
jgi:hypothetical protein